MRQNPQNKRKLENSSFVQCLEFIVMELALQKRTFFSASSPSFVTFHFFLKISVGCTLFIMHICTSTGHKLYYKKKKVAPLTRLSSSSYDETSRCRWECSIPLRLARGVTVRKVQGMGLTKMMFTPGSKKILGTV